MRHPFWNYRVDSGQIRQKYRSSFFDHLNSPKEQVVASQNLIFATKVFATELVRRKIQGHGISIQSRSSYQNQQRYVVLHSAYKPKAAKASTGFNLRGFARTFLLLLAAAIASPQRPCFASLASILSIAARWRGLGSAVAGAAGSYFFNVSFWIASLIAGVSLIANGLIAEWEDRRQDRNHP
jgi:hypothetical protein